MINSPQNWYRGSRCTYLYVAMIRADGTFALGPWGWTVEKTGVGLYKVTHHIGHTQYVGIAIVGPEDYHSTGAIQNPTAQDFTVASFAGTQPTDIDVQLLVATPE